MATASQAGVATHGSDDLDDARCLHELIEAQAVARPDALAVTSGMAKLTYAQLDRQANQLAGHLRRLGVGPESVVAITADRKVETVVGLLGILKAGGAYLPIDPSLPAERIAFLLDDAGAVAIVSPAGHAALLSATALPGVTMDNAAPWREADDSPPPPLARPEHLAYVIYTSGSTGNPKGVLVEHRNIVSSTLARDAFGRCSPEVFLLVIPLSFDAAGQGLYWTLASGGRLVIAHDRQVPDVRTLAGLIRTERVTHLNCVPSLYQVLLEIGGPALTNLQDVSVGGEVATPALVREHRALLPGTALYNDYGPTEATVWATAHRCDLEPPGDDVPIGVAVRATQVHLLDDRLDPVTDGEVGEIFIGGANVARGYQGAAALTAERFVPDPFATDRGGRLYRTGDSGRRRDDGALEFIGRLDHQIKLRGHRIELGEVDAALRLVPGVRDAAAVAAVTRSGDRELVAFVVADDRPAIGNGNGSNEDGALSTVTMRRELGRWLPGQLIPTRIVVLRDLPRTPHGKVDRRHLASLTSDRPEDPHGR